MRKFILGTDWWTDCDDAVALRLLVNAVKAGQAQLLGIVINACMEYSVASVDGFLRKEGLPDIPLGLDADATDFLGTPPYQKRLATYSDKRNEDAEDGVRLYRRLLCEAKEKVEIIEIGFLQVFAALLQSGGDDISPKNGAQLVREKVSKVWVMAGKWDEPIGKEHNFNNNERARRGANIFCEKVPVPVTFLGWEVGHGVISGDTLAKGDVLYDVLQDHGSFHGRHSWDPMTVLLALIGEEKKTGYDTRRGWASVDAQSGDNCFTLDKDGAHQFVIKTKEDSFYKTCVNDRIK